MFGITEEEYKIVDDTISEYISIFDINKTQPYNLYRDYIFSLMVLRERASDQIANPIYTYTSTILQMKDYVKAIHYTSALFHKYTVYYEMNGKTIKIYQSKELESIVKPLIEALNYLSPAQYKAVSDPNKLNSATLWYISRGYKEIFIDIDE